MLPAYHGQWEATQAPSMVQTVGAGFLPSESAQGIATTAGTRQQTTPPHTDTPDGHVWVTGEPGFPPECLGCHLSVI